MKKRSKIILLAISCAGLLGTYSCTKVLDNLADLNTNENQPLVASSPTLLTAAEFSGVMADEGTFVTNGDGDGFLSIYAQQMAGSFAEGINYNIYDLKHTSFQFLFNDAYVSSLMNCKQLIAHAAVNDQGYIGIAQILQAYQLGYLTSVYGDIPWSQALDLVKYPAPKYDAQVDIYTDVQNLLSSAELELDSAINNIGITSAPVSGDFIYGGDLNKWMALSYLLRARYYNHFSKKDPAGSATSALLMVDSAKLAGFDDNKTAGDFVLPYDAQFSVTVNPWYGQYINGAIVANQPFLDHMYAEHDPRINAYFAWIDANGNDVTGRGKIISGTNGSTNPGYQEIGSADQAFDPYNFFGQANSSVEMATYAELLMIEAEAALRAGLPDRAATAHNAGVTAQVNQVVQPGDPLYGEIPAYLAAYASETAGSITLEKIMTEKQKIMFSINAESWMDARRIQNTGFIYPTWMSIPVQFDDVPNPVPVAANFIQRLLYPQSEYDNNATQVPPQNNPLQDLQVPLPILQ